MYYFAKQTFGIYRGNLARTDLRDFLSAFLKATGKMTFTYDLRPMPTFYLVVPHGQGKMPTSYTDSDKRYIFCLPVALAILLFVQRYLQTKSELRPNLSSASLHERELKA